MQISGKINVYKIEPWPYSQGFLYIGKYEWRRK